MSWRRYGASGLRWSCATSEWGYQNRASVLTNRNYEEAVRLMQRATTVPKNTKIDFYNDVSDSCCIVST